MISRLGVSIHADGVHGVLVQRGEIRWRESVACQYTTSTGPETIAALLASLPKRLGVRRATIAVGPAWCQVRQIEGLPATNDLAMLTRLLRENSDSFFLRGAARLEVCDIVRLADGSQWAAAFDHDLAMSVIEALKQQRFVNVRVLPSVIAIASLLPAGAHHWHDGQQATELCVGDRGGLLRVRRSAEPDTSALPMQGLPAALNDSAPATAAAYAAASMHRVTPFVWTPAPDPRRVARLARVRIAGSATLAIGVAAVALIAPGARAERVVRGASHEMEALRMTQTEVARTQGELRRIATTLDHVDQFRERRGKMTVLLGAISQALPESTALVTLRIDSLEGNFVALAPHAADILPQLGSVSELVQPRIVGSLTRESSGATQLERATIRFRRPLPPKSAAPSTPRPTDAGGRR